MFPAQRGTGNKDLREAPRTAGPLSICSYRKSEGVVSIDVKGVFSPAWLLCFFPGCGTVARCLCLFVQIRVRTRGADPGHH